jgi:PTS system nitrogen regulatory IIA component
MKVRIMNPIAELLTPESIVARFETTSKKRLLEHASELIGRLNGLSRQDVFDGLIGRERLGSTGLGLGVAIPHARIAGLERVLGAYLSLSAPLAFDAPDDQPVDLVFVLLVPEAATEQHLELLAQLAEMFATERFRQDLRAAPDAAAAQAVFAAWQG